MSNWTCRRVLVTGGASCIGSHLVDALVARGADVRVVDDLTSGTLENPGGDPQPADKTDVKHHLAEGTIHFIEAHLQLDHAVMAMIAKAFVGQNPFEVWGTGEQLRNWTYVDDIVEGTILAAEKIDDGTAMNLGTMERIRVLDAVQLVLQMLGHQAEIVTCPDMPTGPLNRVADNSSAKRLLGWEPKVSFREGLGRTVEWYFATKDRDEVHRLLEQGGLIERKVSQMTAGVSAGNVLESRDGA